MRSRGSPCGSHLVRPWVYPLSPVGGAPWRERDPGDDEIIVVMLFPAGVVMASSVDAILTARLARWVRVGIVSLIAGLLIVEFIDDWELDEKSRRQLRERMDSVAALLPSHIPEAPILLLGPTAGSTGDERQLDAMMFAQERGCSSTVNGYSGNEPPGYRRATQCEDGIDDLARGLKFFGRDWKQDAIAGRVMALGYPACPDPVFLMSLLEKSQAIDLTTLDDPGVSVCRAWSAVRHERARGWARDYGTVLLGFLSAAAVFGPRPDRSSDADPAAALAWVDGYCQAHPLDPSTAAGTAFVRSQSARPALGHSRQPGGRYFAASKSFRPPCCARPARAPPLRWRPGRSASRVKRSGRSNRSAMRGGRRRAVRRWPAPSRRETWPGARSPSPPIGTPGPAGMRARGGDADRGVRVGQVAAGRVQAADLRLGARRRPAGSRGTAPRARRQARLGHRHPARRRGSRHRLRGVAAASRSSSSNSRRSKLELTWMSMLGDSVGSTGAHRHVVGSRGSGSGCRCGWSRSTSRATGRPIRRAAQAASTLPKLPVGTANATSRSGAPSASAAAT